MQKLKQIFQILSTKEVFIKAIKISLVVGIILNLINQGDLIFNLEFDRINYFKMILTFIVPFCVSAYTAITLKLK